MKLKLKIMGIFASVLLMVSSVSAECTLNPITLDNNVSGSWSSDCNSTHRDGSYAQFYTFTLTGTEIVQIDLTSSADTYLYLLDDANISGTVIDFNDDFGGSLNSQIFRELSAGTYTIEATTFDPNTSGSFELSLTKSLLMTEKYTFKGTVDLPAITLALLEDCDGLGCPRVDISAFISYSEGSQDYIFTQVDYNDSTGKYEYQLDLFAEANTSVEIQITNISTYSIDPVTNKEESFTVGYAFGADWAIGGTGEDADYPTGDHADYVTGVCGSTVPTALHVDLNSSLPIIEIDLSNYIPPIKSVAVISLDNINIPDNIVVLLSGHNENGCGGRGSTYMHDVETVAMDLFDGFEYGFILNLYDWNNYNNFKEYRLNDDDGDFTNGGVFVEDVVYDEFFAPVFDKTIVATSEDINISIPENLNFGNPALVPTIYLLLM